MDQMNKIVFVTITLAMSAYILFIAIAVLPTWYMIYPMHFIFPKSHPWRKQYPTYFQWVGNATPLTLRYGLQMWVCLGLIFWILKTF